MTIKQLKKRLAIIRKLVLELIKRMNEMKPKKDYYAFCLAMRMKESSNRYQVVNSLGYMGAYQFGMARLCDLGYTERIKQGWSNSCFTWKRGYSKKVFLENPNFQDKVFRKHVLNLLLSIDRNYEKYFGAKKNKVLITRSGCVAFAHLAGLGGLRKFLTIGFDPKDVVSGIPATTYMKHFAGYDLT